MRDIEFPPDEGIRDVRPEDPEEQVLYFRRFRGRYQKEITGFDRDQLFEMIRESLKSCPTLRIRHPNDVLRFLELELLITPRQKSKFLRAVTQRILKVVDDWSATKRLDFIFKHIVNRPPPDEEPEFGPWYDELRL